MPNITVKIGSSRRFVYDGLEPIAEYSGANTVLRMHAFGPGIDEPVLQYEGTGTSSRLPLHADERGSIIAQSDGSGVVFAKNKYDEYGIPASGGSGRFRYTGQHWLDEIGMHAWPAMSNSTG